MSTKNLFQLSPEIQAAAATGKAIVALESTVIAHGLPRPHNFTTAQRLEAIVREAGALPATIAMLNGKFHVGLDDGQLKHIAESDDVHKLSRRDLPIALAREWDGATTVATTLWVAARVGISVFATGGIGGVHRGDLPDVSADLPELARIPMVVVCSGAKIILDLPATREWLETYGVTVVGYQCDEFPAFYARSSGLPVDVRADSADEVAKILKARRELDLAGAVLVTVPVPAEAEMPADKAQAVLDKALHEAEQQHIRGRELTPFLLSRMSALSEGATLKANIALLENNARIAAEIAKALVRKKEGLGFVRGI
jgi:pseudouridine-5'-phosphate glycosidase